MRELDEECLECGGVFVHSEDCTRGAREQREADDDQEDDDDDEARDTDPGDPPSEDETLEHDEWCPGCELCR